MIGRRYGSAGQRACVTENEIVDECRDTSRSLVAPKPARAEADL